MKTVLISCLVIGLGSANAFGSEGVPAPAPSELHRTFQSLFAIDASPHDEGPAVPSRAAPGDIEPGEALGAYLEGLAWGVHDEASRRPGSVDPADSSSDWGSGSSITWGPLLAQSVGTLAFQHWFRATFEDGTWAATLEGPFWDDYVNSVKGLCCWNDGDRGTTNWLFHPMLGSAAAFLFANNHRGSQLTPPGNNKAYWGVKGKQMLFSFAYSTYFELGPLLSEAAIGNVGLDHSEQTWHDLIVTPTLGTAFSIGEDLLRVHVIDRVDRKNHFWGATLAIFLNPTRTFANLFALKVPWSGPAWSVAERTGAAPRR